MSGLTPRIEWNRLWGDSNAQGNGTAVFEELVQAYSVPRRHYHTINHVMWVLKRIDEIVVATTPGSPSLDLRWAAWYHDAVLDGTSGDEFASSEAARKMLTSHGLSDGFANSVTRLIKATAHEGASLAADESVLVDADISILGADREHFDEYERLVRLEWPDVSDDAFAVARANILQRFLDRPKIYFTEYGRERWEAKARENLGYSIGKLRVQA